ncbi:MAG: Fe-S cluster assembly protein SufD [Alphaproteobacteria bacterium]|nr:MAG: Fe-S cluster assembly protein SufD [Alphaproteobacteria bacterium]
MVKILHLHNPEIGKHFEGIRSSLTGADQAWLGAVREEAMTRFTNTGIPGPKVEEWKYTNLGFLANENFAVGTKADQTSEIKAFYDAAYLADIAGPVVVFVNGHIYPALSSYPDEEGVEFSVFSENTSAFRDTLESSDQASSLNDLNRAMVTDGYRLDIAAGVQVRQPIQIIHIVTSATDMKLIPVRSQVTASKGAKARIIETFIGAENERYWGHMISETTLHDAADISLIQFQLQGKQAIHMTELHTTVAEKANFSHMSLQLGAEISRTELINSFTGEYAHIDLRGAYLGRVKQSHDIYTRINHDQPNCQSNQLYRGVLDEGGKSAFQGKVVVARDAQKTNADQSNKNLLLSRKAEANAKPELLIYADDVKCSHGATVGEMDANQLFYLRSRGLDEVAAKGLLVEAFVAEVFDDMDDEILRDAFKAKAAGWLSREERA